MSVSAAPLDLDEVLSPRWLSATLSTVTDRPVRVADVEVVETLTSIASKVRFRVTYHDAPPASLPTSFCVKGYFSDEGRQRAWIGRVEASFYRDVAPAIGVRVPRCIHAGIDDETGHGLVLMTDLVAAGSVFLTALSPYTTDQAAATLEQLARLHTADPDGRVTGDLAWLDRDFGSYLDYVTEARLQELLDDGRGGGLAPATRQASRVRRAFRALTEGAVARPRCLIHGDAHAGNLFLTLDGEPGLIDWQVVQRAPWELDVAYHLAAVLDPADRAKHERALVDHYLDAVRSRGGEPPSSSDGWDAYRRALVYGYLMWSMTQRVDKRIVDTFVDRLGKAVEAHESLDRAERNLS